jgi:multidrug efflux pump subunit AcrA (membrane-fusion protein)
MKIKSIVLFLAVALLSVGITYTVMRKSSTPSPSVSAHAEEGEHESEQMKIEGLQVSPAVAGEGWNVVAVTGKVTIPPDRLVKISPRIEGKIVVAHGTVGDYIRRGQLLAVISSVELAEARAEYRQALSRLNAAKKSYERELQIVKLGGVSTRPFEEARADNLSSQGDLADAKSELAQSKSQLAREESELIQCKARYERAKELYADKIISKQDLESAEAEYKRDLASVEAVKS